MALDAIVDVTAERGSRNAESVAALVRSNARAAALVSFAVDADYLGLRRTLRI